MAGFGTRRGGGGLALTRHAGGGGIGALMRHTGGGGLGTHETRIPHTSPRIHKAVHIQAGANARRCTHKAVHTKGGLQPPQGSSYLRAHRQGGTHKRRYTHKAVHTKGGVQPPHEFC